MLYRNRNMPFCFPVEDRCFEGAITERGNAEKNSERNDRVDTEVLPRSRKGIQYRKRKTGGQCTPFTVFSVLAEFAKVVKWNSADTATLHNNSRIHFSPLIISCGILLSMELDPHTLQQILQRIYQQMRCPQCGNRVPVDFSAVRVIAAGSLLLQLKCEDCNAFIVLHASIQGIPKIGMQEEQSGMTNASSTLQLSGQEMEMLHQALQESGGSFEKLFAKYGASEKKEKNDGLG